jgi:hypothetical protein
LLCLAPWLMTLFCFLFSSFLFICNIIFML